MYNALIIIAHGSKKESSNNEFISMVDSIRDSSEHYDFIEASFLELASPSIEYSVNKLSAKNVNKIDFYPFFLNSGKHVVVDIPNIVDELSNRYSEIEFNILRHFGKSDNIESIILKDISQKI